MEPFVTLQDILLRLKQDVTAGHTLDHWHAGCLYAEPQVCIQSRYHLSDRCCLAAATTVDDRLLEHLPPELQTMGLGLYCYGSDLADVVSSAVRQKPGIGAQGLLDALNYYRVNDSLMDFSAVKSRPTRWHIGIFPQFSPSQLQDELKRTCPDFLTQGRLLEYPSGSVLLASGDSELISLCDRISQPSKWALYLFLSLPTPAKDGYWDHTLYQSWPVSPCRHPDDRSLKQPRLVVNTDLLAQAFPGTEPEYLAQYFQSDHVISVRQRSWEEYMLRRHRQKGWTPPAPRPAHRIRPCDQYRTDDWRQVFDLLRYLSFPLQEELGVL